MGAMHSSSPPALVWFRQDLRLADNPALGRDRRPGRGPPHPAGLSSWTMRRRPLGAGRCRALVAASSLAALGRSLAARGAPLLLLRGRAEIVIPALADAVGAAEVFAGRLYEPWARERDQRIAEALEAAGRQLRLSTSSLLREPTQRQERQRQALRRLHALRQGGGRHGRAGGAAAGARSGCRAWRRRRRARRWRTGRCSRPPCRLGRRPSPPSGPRARPARRRGWRDSRRGRRGYAGAAQRPGVDGSSGLSPHLHWGEISPRQVWAAVQAAMPGEVVPGAPA